MLRNYSGWLYSSIIGRLSLSVVCIVHARIPHLRRQVVGLVHALMVIALLHLLEMQVLELLLV